MKWTEEAIEAATDEIESLAGDRWDLTLEDVFGWVPQILDAAAAAQQPSAILKVGEGCVEAST